MAKLFEMPLLFNTQAGVWGMTAAQRALLLGKPKEDKKTSAAESYRPKRVSLKELSALSERENKRMGTAAQK